MIERIKNALFGSRRQARQISSLTASLEQLRRELEEERSNRANEVNLFVQTPPEGGEVYLLSDEDARDRMSALQLELYIANIDRFPRRVNADK